MVSQWPEAAMYRCLLCEESDNRFFNRHEVAREHVLESHGEVTAEDLASSIPSYMDGQESLMPYPRIRYVTPNGIEWLEERPLPMMPDNQGTGPQ
jgi:hypothetical protein